MLTGPLNLARFRNGIAYPHYLQPNDKNLKISRDLIDLFMRSEGEKRHEIEEAIKSFYVEKINPKIVQGLAKILFNRCQFQEFGDENPGLIREKIFSKSAERWAETSDFPNSLLRHKEKILAELGYNENAAISDTESWLFRDIHNNQRLASFEALESDSHIHRFNIQQVQGLLLNAEHLELNILLKENSSFRQMMQLLKFFQLMFEVLDHENDWLKLKIDGPGSVLDNARSYGVELANFFPAVLLLKVPWRISSKLKIPGRRRRFDLELSDEKHYQTFYTHRGVWKHEKMLQLIERIKEKYKGEYSAEMDNKIIPLRGNRYLIPDIKIKNANNDKEMSVEWIQYLSEGMIKKLKNTADVLPEDYVFAVKGSKTKLKNLEKKLKGRLIIFAKEPTAPTIIKKYQELHDT